MASHELLKDIVRNGSNLVITRGADYDVLRELAALASHSGAKLMLTTKMSGDVVRELSSTYGSTLTFINGLDSFEKD